MLLLRCGVNLRSKQSHGHFPAISAPVHYVVSAP